MKYWDRFMRQVQCDVRLWLFAMAALSLYRVTFLLLFRDHLLPDGQRMHVLLALAKGLLFDMRPVTYLLLPSLALSTLCGFWDVERSARRVRAVAGVLYCIATPFLCCAAAEYYREFHDLFNQTLFNAYYDEQGILLETLYSDYHLTRNLMICAALTAISLVLLRRWVRRPFVSEQWWAAHTASHRARLAVGTVLGALVVIGLRGSAGHAPIGPGNAIVSPDTLVNKAVVNPYMALFYAAKVHQSLVGAAALKSHLPDEDVVGAARRAFPDAPAGDDLDRCLLRTAAGPPNAPPKHIFMLGMESYDAWTMMDEYRSLGMTNQLRRLAHDGLHFKSFLPSGDYSIVFIASVVAGMPEAALPIAHHRASSKPFPTALPETLRKLGYRTRFFCGAPLSWQNVERFCPSQGFDEVYGSTDFVRGTRSGGNQNLWGALDEALFDFAASKIKDDEPSFTFIFTSSYHVPYTVDLEAEGCPLKEVPADLKSKWEVDPKEHLRQLGHLWYSDRCLGRFVDAMQARLTRPLFAITGDHFGRHFINSHPTMYERSAVPLVLYGPEVLRGIKLPDGVAGGHIDICPTLIELAAPRGFQYYAFGQNLLAPQRRFFGYGSGKVMGHDFLAETDHPEELCPIPGQPLPTARPDIAELSNLYRAMRGLSWWRIEHGAKLPARLPADAPQIARAAGKSPATHP